MVCVVLATPGGTKPQREAHLSPEPVLNEGRYSTKVQEDGGVRVGIKDRLDVPGHRGQ